MVCAPVHQLQNHGQKVRLEPPSMKLNRFTLQELHLLADSLYWEYAIFDKMGWADSARSRRLEALQTKIHEYLDERTRNE